MNPTIDCRSALQDAFDATAVAFRAAPRGSVERAAADIRCRALIAAIVECDDLTVANADARAVVCGTIRDTPERAAAEQSLDAVLASQAAFITTATALIDGM